MRYGRAVSEAIFETVVTLVSLSDAGRGGSSCGRYGWKRAWEKRSDVSE